MRFSGHPDDWPDDEWEEYVAERRRREEAAAAKAALFIPTTDQIRGAWHAWSDGQDDSHDDKPTWSTEEFNRWFAQELTTAFFIGAEALSEQNAKDHFDGSNTPEFDSPYGDGISYNEWQAAQDGS